jgi:hypothetical protein
MLCLYLSQLLTVEYFTFVSPQSVTPKSLSDVKGTHILSLTKYCGQMVSTLVLYVEGPKFIC